MFCVLLCSCGGRSSTDDYKKDVTIWYDAFNTKDARLVDRIRRLRVLLGNCACGERRRGEYSDCEGVGA